jgi:hypothetical protein
MPILVGVFVLAMGAGWRSVGGQMLASGVLLLCGYQDVTLRSRVGAAFWFFMALAFCVSALATAFRADLPYGVAVSVGVLCLETWLIRRWRHRPL